jgi:hypothetical protein
MLRKIELGFYIFLAIIGLGLIIANVIHYIQFGNFSSPPAIIGGSLILIYSSWAFIKTKRKIKEDKSVL